jgi:hypothetical protein
VGGEPGGPADACRRLVLAGGRLQGSPAARSIAGGAGGAGIARGAGRGTSGTTSAGSQLELTDDEPAADPDQPLPRHLVDELSCVASWLESEARRVRLVHCEGPWAVPLPRLPRFEPVRARARPAPVAPGA